MTELHPKAKSLIRLAQAGQEPSADQLRQVMRGFHQEAGARSLNNVSRFAQKSQGAPGGSANLTEAEKRRLNRKLDVATWTADVAHQWRRRMLKWSMLAAIMTGSVGAFANWGPELPVLGAMAEQVKATLGTLVANVVGADKAARPNKETALRANGTEVDGRGSAPVEGIPVDAVAVAAEVAPGTPPSPPVVEASRISSATASNLGARGPSSAAPSSSRYNGPNPNVGVADSAELTQQPGVVNSSHATSPADVEPIAAKGPSAFSEAEVNLIAAARSALAASNYPQTRRLLDEHRTTFARGALSEERETLRALVACRESGDTSLAQRYLARRPQSLFAARLTRECGL